MVLQDKASKTNSIKAHGLARNRPRFPASLLQSGLVEAVTLGKMLPYLLSRGAKEKESRGILLLRNKQEIISC